MYRKVNRIITLNIIDMNITRKIFRVVAVSDNTNSFGLKQFIMIAKDGEAYRSHASFQFAPKKGDNVVRLLKIVDGKEYRVWGGSFEMTEKLARPTDDVLKEIFK